MRKRIISLILAFLIIFASLPAYAKLPLNYKEIIDIPWQIYFKNKTTNLKKYENVHPRIWLDNDDFERIKGYTELDEYKKLYDTILKTADNCVKSGPSEFKESGENTWMNTQGKKLVPLVFAYKISGKPEYLESLNKYIDVISDYPAWSNKANGTNCHLAGASNFMSFGLVYDWLYDELTPERREKIVENIKTRIEDFDEPSADYGFDKINCHNMLVINTSSMVALGAMYEKIPKAEEYMKRMAAKFATLTMELMPDDGAAFEAVNYSAHTWNGLMQAGIVMRDLLNVDILSHPTFDNYVKFSCYSYIPVNSFPIGNDVFGWGDGTETSSGNLLPTMAFMAKEKKNPVYKYFVEKRLDYIYSVDGTNGLAIYPLMFADPDLKSKSPEEYKDNENGKIYFPLDFKSSDADYVFLRDSWSGDEASIHFHCGPVMGETAAYYRKIYKGSTLGVGHNHPDMASPLIFAEGEWLFEDDNYVSGMTRNHNTLTINNFGQRAQLGTIRSTQTDYGFTGWQAQTFMKPKVVKMETFGDMTYVVCDVTDAYPDYHYGSLNLNLKNYKRHFIYLKPEKALLVLDDVHTFVDSDLEIRWRPATQNASMKNDGSYFYNNKNSTMRIEAFKSDGVEIINSLVQANSDKSSNYKDALMLQLKKHGKDWIQPTAISWQTNGKGEPLNTTFARNGSKCTFSTNDSTITIDIDTLEIVRERNDSEVNLKLNDKLSFLENDILTENGTSYLEENELVSLLNLENKDGIISGTKKEFEISSLNNKPVIKDDKTYLPVRELCEKLNIALWWDDDAGCICIDTNADTSNTEIFSLSVSGVPATLDEDGNYSAEIFTDKVVIDVTPVSNGATFDIEYSENGFGENKVKVTSLDKTKVKEYIATVNPVKTLGKYPVYNVISDATYSEIMTLIDGKLSSAWAVEGSGIETIFDFGSVVDLTSVSISCFYGDLRQQIFAVLASEDGINYTETFNGKASGKTTDFEKYPINQKARFVKIIFGGHSNGGGWNNTNEIKFD